MILSITRTRPAYILGHFTYVKDLPVPLLQVGCFLAHVAVQHQFGTVVRLVDMDTEQRLLVTLTASAHFVVKYLDTLCPRSSLYNNSNLASRNTWTRFCSKAGDAHPNLLLPNGLFHLWVVVALNDLVGI